MEGIRCRLDTLVRFARAAALQHQLVELRLADHIPDCLLVLQHPPTVTLGRRARDGHLKTSAEALRARGIDLEVAARGGDVTYHGPGQWVLYPILRLTGQTSGLHGYLHRLEEIALRTTASFGVKAFRRPGMSGAWTPAGKIAAIGFRIRRWVTFHGMSYNVDVDLQGFEWIVPCGLAGEPVTSLREILGTRCPADGAAADCLEAHAAEVLQCTFRPLEKAGGPGAERVRQAVQAAVDDPR